MAIFHCAVSHGSRKTGQSGAAKVDYLMRTGKYSRDPGELLGARAGHLPSWADGNPHVFFAAADEYERSNGRLFTQVIFAIPHELSDEDSLQLAYHYAEAVTENGAPYALAVHRGGVEGPDVESAAAAPQEADEEDLPPHNRHGHLVICERIDDGIERTAKEWFRRANKKEPALGGAAKDREMNGGNWVPEVRNLCATYINYGLERAGFSERVTCESHETRIARAEAAGDDETAERLRLTPPGIHLGPTAWAMETDRRGRRGRPSWRGDLNRAIQAEAAKLREKVEGLNAQLGELDIEQAGVDEKLAGARQVAAAQFARREEALQKTAAGEEALRAARVEVAGDTGVALSVVQQGEVVELAEQFGAALDAGVEDIESVYAAAWSRDEDPLSALAAATEEKRRQVRIVSSARSALLTDATIEAIRSAAEGKRKGSGWTAVEEATAEQMQWKLAAETAAEEVGLDADSVYARAKEENADAVAMLEQATGIFMSAREAGLGIDEIDAIRREAEKERRGSEWLAVEAATAARVERKAAAATSAEDAGVDVTAALETAAFLGEDPAAFLERVTEIAVAARAALLRDAAVRNIHDAAESKVRGSGWPAIESATEARLERKQAAETGARRTSITDVAVVAVYDDAWSRGADPVAALEDETARQRAAAEQRRREQRRAKLFRHRDGKTLYFGKLDELEPSWRQTGKALNEHIDRALEHAETTLAARARQAAEEREQRLDAGLSALRKRRCEGVSVGGDWFYARKLAALEVGQRQSSPDRREQALAWAERQMDRLDSLREGNVLDLFFGKLDELGAAQRPEDIEGALDHAEERLRQDAERRQGRLDALSEDERMFFDKRLDEVEPSWRETTTAQPANIDDALEYTRTQLDALDRYIERRRMGIHKTRGDGYTRLLRAGFESESRRRKVRALTTVEAYLNEDFGRQEETIRTHADGENILRRARVEILGADRQPETLADRSAVIDAAVAHLRQEETDRRAARHQMVSDTHGGDERLRAAGWEEARDDSDQDRVLEIVEHDLATDFDRREQRIRIDAEGAAFLHRARVEVLEAEREPGTLVERGRVIERAEALQRAAVVERKRRVAEQRVARLKELFTASGGDTAFFAALDARKPSWRERGTAPADIDHALDLAEQRVDRTKPATAEHVVVVNAEQAFSDAPSAAWRQAGGRFPKGSVHARVSQRLSERTRACALAAEREERPATPALVQRIFTWLRTQVDKLLERLGVVKPVTRPPAPEPAQPVSAAPTGHRTDAEEAREKSVSDREVAICTVPEGVGRLRAEEERIHGGSGRPLSLKERESVASTVEDWIRAGMRADVERVIGETCAAVGFAPPVQIWRVVGRRLHDEREYIPGSRPDLFVSTLKTLPSETRDVPTDEEQTLRAALDAQRHEEAEARYQKSLKEYDRDLQTWRDSGGLFKSRGWRQPKKPKKPEPVPPPTQEQVEKFRQNLVSKMTSFPRGWIEQWYDPRERARPLRPDEEPPDRPSVIAHAAPRRRRQPARDDNGPSRP